MMKSVFYFSSLSIKSIIYMVELRAIVHICEAILGLQSYNALLDDLSVVI